MIAALRMHMYIVVLSAVIVFGSWISIAHAESVTWNQVQPNLISTGELGPRRSWTTWLSGINVSIIYGASVWELDASGNKTRPLSGGESLPQGTKVLFEFKPHVYDDISWSGTGSAHGTPYGDWVANAVLPGPVSDICIPKNKYEGDSYVKSIGLSTHAELSVAPPVKDVTISGVGSCVPTGSNGDKICTLTDPGSLDVVFTFTPTYGYWYHGYKYLNGVNHYTPPGGPNACDHLGRPMETYTGSNFDQQVLPQNRTVFKMPVPQQTIPFTLVVTDSPQDPDSHTPTTPSLTSGACTVGTPHSITMTSSDPDNDPIRYGIDWDADGSVDQFVPPSGYVPSGTSQSASRTYTIAGTKTVKVYTQDQGGLSSPWTTVSFSCSQPATTQCADGVDNDGDGLMDQNDPDCSSSSDLSEFSSIPSASALPAGLPTANLRLTVPSLIARGKTVQVTWSADNVASCNPVIGTNGDSFPHLTLGDTFYSPVGGRTSSDITGRTTYTLSCIDLNGTPHTKTATVNIAPRVRER